jgi:hypothetical protein
VSAASRAGLLVLALAFVLIVGTANAGGYRFGVSDQAFYIPAVEMVAGTASFPRDRAVFGAQMRFWLGDEALGSLVALTGVSVDHLFAALYVASTAGLALAVATLARALGCGPWTIALALVLLTLRHRIARTGANSLEGYFHPRMLAFACGVAATAMAVQLRWQRAVFWTAVAAVVHSSTAVWFAGALATAAWWPRRLTTGGRRVGVAVGAIAVVAWLFAAFRLPRMDDAWLAVLGDRDYLFSLDWPAYAWATNLSYLLLLMVIVRTRARAGLTRAGEEAVVAGFVALVVSFFATLPLTGLRTAFAVQLQANRVFWLLDVFVMVYLAWWLSEHLGSRRPQMRKAVLAAMLAGATARAVFVLAETDRPLARVSLAGDPYWLDAMEWLGRQDDDWHVLADPAHAWKYGVSVRAAARRDTPLELGKDPAMAMYDRDLAMRVAERRALLAGFDSLSSVEQVRALDAQLDLDAFVDRADRQFDLPVLYRNARFVVYDLR